MKPFSLVIIISIPLIILLARNYENLIGKVVVRIALVLFSFCAIISSLVPSVTNSVARSVGIGRGADLIFYFTSIGLFSLSIITIAKFIQVDKKYELIVREIAITSFVENSKQQKDIN